MNRKILFSFVVVVMAIASQAKTLDPVTIAWKPKVGATYNFKWKSTATNVQSNELKMGSDMVETIKSITADNNVIVEDKQTHFSFILGGNDLSNNPQVPSSITETITEAPNGHVISKTTDSQNQDSPRLDAMSQFIYPDHPVNAGDTWTYKGKGDSVKQTVDYEIDYKYIGQETADGVDAYKVSASFKELSGKTPMTGQGTIWVDTTTGEMVKTSMAVKNADLGALGTTDISVDIDRQS